MSTLAHRFRQGLLVGLGLAVLVYGGYFVLVGWRDVATAIGRLSFAAAAGLLALSLGNYGLRFLRWELFLRALGLRVAWRSSLSVFLAGLAMTITPGKVGEFLKSWLLLQTDRVPMERTAPVVFVERIGDLLGLLALASVGVASYGGAGAGPALGLAAAGIGVALVVLQSEALSGIALGLVGRLPGGGAISGRLGGALAAARILLHPRTLIPGLLLATAAWYLECLGYFLAFEALGQPIEHGVAVFGYAFSTVAGVISPGGLGPTDVGLVEIARRFTPGMRDDVAAAASFVVRVATLWFAVGLGAIALLRFRGAMDVDVEAARAGGAPP